MQDILAISEVKLSYKPKVKASERPVIKCSRDIYKLLINSVFDTETIEHREYLKVVLSNRAGKVLGVHAVSMGGTSETSADLKIILQGAILANATGMILCHNHPSGNLSPSAQDDLLTQRLQKAAKLMDISLLDHLIISAEGYYSYADEGRI